jgi:hypothetical protein
MLLDELQQTWQSQQRVRLAIDPNVLLAELRRNQRSFKTTIFWRDFREVAAALVVVVVFTIGGLGERGWPWLVIAASGVFVGGFILVDRFRRRGRSAAFGDSLVGCVEASLADVEHQIWLLRNIFWWYLLPPSIGLVISFVYDAMRIEEARWLPWIELFIRAGVCALVFAGVYWLNQYAVRKSLEPRRQELLAARDGLIDRDSK